MPCRINKRVVIDVDPRNHGDAGIMALGETCGPLVSPWRYRSGSGGEHRHFQDPGGMLHTKLKPYSGVDFKCDGYVILPPSPHASGGRYELDENSDLSQPVPPMPDALVALLSKATDLAGGPTTPRVEASAALRAARLVAPYWPKSDSGQRDDFAGALAGGLGRAIEDDDTILDFIEQAAELGEASHAVPEVAKRKDFARRTLRKLRLDPESADVTGFPAAFECAACPGLKDIVPTVIGLLTEASVTEIDPASVPVESVIVPPFPEIAKVGLAHE
jgi:hypothetical protein